MKLIIYLSHDSGHSPLREFWSESRPLRRYIGKLGQLSPFRSTVIENSFLCLAGLQLRQFDPHKYVIIQIALSICYFTIISISLEVYLDTIVA